MIKINVKTHKAWGIFLNKEDRGLDDYVAEDILICDRETGNMFGPMQKSTAELKIYDKNPKEKGTIKVTITKLKRKVIDRNYYDLCGFCGKNEMREVSIYKNLYDLITDLIIKGQLETNRPYWIRLVYPK